MSANKEESFFSSLCIERCGAHCCDPWWGIISYTMSKSKGPGGIDSLRAEVLKGIKERALRIMEAYVTKESPPRRLFGEPERYNVKVAGINASGASIRISLLAMFAFRCRYLSPEKACMLHPAVTGDGRDIRPQHCAYLGSLNAAPNEKGYCRIIHAAEAGSEEAITRSIEIEKGSSLKHYNEGFSTPEEAADEVARQVKDYCASRAPELLEEDKPKTPGRNEPCWCGSGVKFKKCHGK